MPLGSGAALVGEAGKEETSLSWFLFNLRDPFQLTGSAFFSGYRFFSEALLLLRHHLASKLVLWLFVKTTSCKQSPQTTFEALGVF